MVNSGGNSKKNDCLAAAAQEAQRNKLQSRAAILVNPANSPCEDRFNCHQFDNLDGFYSAVFDGHGGWQISELAMKHLHTLIDKELK